MDTDAEIYAVDYDIFSTSVQVVDVFQRLDYAVDSAVSGIIQDLQAKQLAGRRHATDTGYVMQMVLGRAVTRVCFRSV
jgi:hypothetical protein